MKPDVWHDPLFLAALAANGRGGTASGSIVTFRAYGNPLRSLRLDIDPVQDLHGYDNPWPAGGGKNKFDVSKIESYTDKYGGIISQSNGTISVTTSTGSSNVRCGKTLRQLAPLLTVGETYIITGNSTATSAKQIYLYAISTLWKFGDPLTITQEVLNSEIGFYAGGTNTSATITQVMIRLSSVSDATFASYSNICPISGWSEVNLWRTGVNIWDEQWEVGTFDNTTGLPVASSSVIRSKNFIPVLPNTRYYMTVAIGYRYAYDADKNFIKVFDLNYGPIPANCHFIKFRLTSSYGTTYKHDISINYPSTDHDYHAYDGDTYPITIPMPPGTVYGGYIQVGADGSAELVVDRALRTFTGQEQGWEKFSDNNPNGTYFGLAGTTSYAAFADDPDAICSINKRSASAALLTGDGFYWTSGGWRILYGAAGGTESLDNFKMYLQQMYAAGTPVAVCAKLATPITYTLSDITVQTLDGQNTMWGDSGDISVEWGRDKRINKEAILAMIIGQEN